MARNQRADKKDQYASYMTFDEYGRPFIILREQSEKEQISGVDVIKVSTLLYSRQGYFTFSVRI